MICFGLALAVLAAAGRRRAQRLRHRARVGRARRGARRRQGQGLHGDQRAAGPASRRGEAQPHRARAQRRSRRRHRRRARGRVAAARDAAGREPEDPARASPATSRPRRYVTLLEQAGAARSRRGRRPPGRQSAHPDRSAQHRARRRPARRAARRDRSAERRVLPGALQGVRRVAGARRSRAGRRRRRRSRARRSSSSTRPSLTSIAWLGLEGSRGARAQARRRADDAHLSEVLAIAAAAAGEDGAARRVPERPRVAVDRGAREDQRRRAAVHRRRRRRGEGPLRRSSTTRSRGCSRGRNELERRRSLDPRCPRSRQACSSPRRTCRSACRCSPAASCSSTSRSRRSRAAACCSPTARVRGRRASRCRSPRSPRRSRGALLLTWTERHLAGRAGSGDRRRVRARGHGRRTAAREQRPRQRASARPARRADPLGAAERVSLWTAVVYALVLALWFAVGRAPRPHGLLRALRAAPSPSRCSSSGSTSCLRR